MQCALVNKNFLLLIRKYKIRGTVCQRNSDHEIIEISIDHLLDIGPPDKGFPYYFRIGFTVWGLHHLADQKAHDFYPGHSGNHLQPPPVVRLKPCRLSTLHVFSQILFHGIRVGVLMTRKTRRSGDSFWRLMGEFIGTRRRFPCPTLTFSLPMKNVPSPETTWRDTLELALWRGLPFNICSLQV